jgi:hypothetical protein
VLLLLHAMLASCWQLHHQPASLHLQHQRQLHRLAVSCLQQQLQLRDDSSRRHTANGSSRGSCWPSRLQRPPLPTLLLLLLVMVLCLWPCLLLLLLASVRHKPCLLQVLWAQLLVLLQAAGQAAAAGRATADGHRAAGLQMARTLPLQPLLWLLRHRWLPALLQVVPLLLLALLLWHRRPAAAHLTQGLRWHTPALICLLPLLHQGHVQLPLLLLLVAGRHEGALAGQVPTRLLCQRGQLLPPLTGWVAAGRAVAL